MQLSFRKIVPYFLAMLSPFPCVAATFGTVVPIRGSISDIALDESRGRVYAANLTANNVAVVDTSNLNVLSPLPVPTPPSCVALSPDGRYLVVGELAPPPSDMTQGGFTVFDLNAGTRQDVALPGSTLTVAFGAGSKALMVTTAGVFTVDPSSAVAIPLQAAKLTSLNLPAPLASFPPQIAQASSGVSGDGQTIIALATITSGSAYVLIRYSVRSGRMTAEAFTTAPQLGPYSVAVDQDGTNALAGWVLFHQLDQSYAWAQIPNSTGAPNIGTSVWDLGRNVIYAQEMVTGDGPVLHVLDTDNLNVRERIQLPQNLAGRSIISSDDQTMYSVSVSGITVLPIGRLSSTPQIGALEEDLTFMGDACNRGVITKTLDLVDLGNAGGNFTLSVPSGTNGVHILTTSGTAPAQVQIQVDPAAFQKSKGTTVIPLTITTANGVNLPSPVRLLINTRDFNQRGTILDVPGKLVDLLADPGRNRFYVLRQDTNLVLVFDSTSMTQIAALRTGNTPTKMAITADGQYLMVGNDNSQIANVYDLNSLTADTPILFPFGHYPRTFGVSLNGIFATARVVSGTNVLDEVNFAARTADVPASLGVYQNTISENAVLAESPDHQYLVLYEPDGNVVEYDTSVATWVASRKDLTSLGGAYGVITDNLFLADTHLLDESLVPVEDFGTTTGYSSGAGFINGAGLRTTAQSATGQGLIERIDLQTLQPYHGTALAEAPVHSADLMTSPVGLIGESILPFVRTLAVSADQSTIALLTVSGLTVLTPDFDAVTQAPAISSVTNAADGSVAVAPGGLVEIAGIGLAPRSAAAGTLPLPTSLGDTCVSVDSVALPLFSVSPNLIMAQLPYAPTGKTTATVRNPGGISSNFDLTILPQAPAIFRTGQAGDQTGLATVIRDDNLELVDFTNPIHPKLSITIYLTGMGTASPEPALGAPASAEPMSMVDAAPQVTLGSATLTVTFAGLTPDEVGVYQINAVVPDRVPVGTSVPLTVSQGGSETTLSVRVVSP